MNDRTAEKIYILEAVCTDHNTRLKLHALREDTQYGTEAYFFRLEFRYNKQVISAESYNFSVAVDQLWNAAETIGMLDGQFIID